MSLNLAMLAVQGLQAVASARQRRHLAAAVVAGLAAVLLLFVAVLMAAVAGYLGFSTILPPPWAAAATAASLLAAAGLVGLVLLRLRPQPASPLQEAVSQIEPLIRQHPTTALLAAAVLGGLTGIVARR
ncbi:hypothetical protein [Ferrovibrio sp.]|uniref:hypothetical protein n=1 Tax=Ferrovibrio sp. TaxID=1917215 RepID=UPI003511A0A5